MKRIFALVLIVLLTLSCAQAAMRVVSPDADAYYLDTANVLSDATEGEIYFLNKRLEDACGGQIAVVALTLGSVLWALGALGLGGTGHTLPGVITNALWGLNNCLAMAGMIGAALWQPPDNLDEGASTA